MWSEADQGRSFNAGCSYNFYNNKKYLEGGEVILGGGCNFLTADEGDVDKFGDIRYISGNLSSF